MITETDEVAEALDVAATHWPETKSRRELLLRLVLEGRDAVERRQDEEIARRRIAIRETSGALTGATNRGTSTAYATTGRRDRR